ncbi:MAG: CDP-alcohol phosphatidyltransferase family protein [Chloroflexota bacterium]
MRDSVLRRQKDRLMTPLAEQLFTAVHPNVVSVVALGVGLLSATAILYGEFTAGLALWILNRILDGLDGVVARAHDKQSDFGGYLDLLLDFIVYLAIPIAFMVALPTMPNMWAGVALLAVYVINLLSWSTLAAILEKRQLQSSDRLTTMEMPTGLIEGAETIAFYCLFYIFPGAIVYLFGLMALLVFFTAGQRVWWVYRNL